MKFLQSAVATGVALLFGGAALTQAQTPTPPPVLTDPASSLSALDTDRDGSISRAEAAINPSLSAQFVTLDSNTNNALEPAEFSRFESAGAAGTTRGTPGVPGDPGTPGSPVAPASPPPPSGTTTPPSSGTTAPSSTSPAPGSTSSPPPGGG